MPDTGLSTLGMFLCDTDSVLQERGTSIGEVDRVYNVTLFQILHKLVNGHSSTVSSLSGVEAPRCGNAMTFHARGSSLGNPYIF